ncbi:MAG: thiamine-phosphate kinase [Thermomicrobiales bacterium]|nr:thiamine-phosphate kinase [Thermomicrobiales bacterium]MCO5217562.1 thiamine-phosphate kinase [Thermomicrobiales bacterium]MCO5224132.1 thiamine-phosphate kinase [Thermomicrobiales bacterium]MCO5226967.1 thiamine-phosphate kinase [Thermomicrobiales bacterium]
MSERVRHLGEFVLIERLIAALPEAVRGDTRVHGAGDDCAWWRNDGDRTVVTADAMVAGVHFRLDWTDWRSLGHKLLAVNLSDLASMGARPRVGIVTLALTGDEQVSDLEAMYRGMGELAAIYDVVIAGGDIVRTTGPQVFSLTAIGDLQGDDHLMTRSAAKPSEVVMVSGTLGASGAGWQLLLHPNPEAKSGDLLIADHLRPQPRVSLGRMLAANGVRCCMDLSDGLAGDLPKVLQASSVGAMIDTRKIPVVPAVRSLFPDTWLDLSLSGGEDYELLFTTTPDRVAELTALAREVGATVTVIGEIIAAPGLTWIDELGHPIRLDTGAWDHFSESGADAD